MKKFYTMVLAMAFILSAANVAVLDNSKTTGYQISDSADEYLEVGFSIGSIIHNEINTEKGVFSKLEIEKGYLTRNEGSPALPAMHELIAIPYGAEPSVEVISYDKKVYSLKELGIEHPVFPAQPSYSKMTKPEDIKFIYNESAYMSSKFNDGVLAEVSKSGTMRGVGVGVLKIYPFKYNPTEGTVEVYNDLKVRVNFKGSTSNAKGKAVEEYSPYFESAMSQLINYKSPALDSKADLMSYPVTYLIVAATALNGNADLNRLIAWKKEKGFNVIVNYVATSSTISTNDSWVENQYNTLNPKPSFVLIVGDADGTYAVQAELDPPLGSTGDVCGSDLMYGVMGATGTTNRIPSMYVGRMTVRAAADLTAQVDKTLWYEKEQFLVATPDLAYLTAPIGTAGYDTGFGVSHGNPQIYYGWTYYFNSANGMPNATTHYYPDSGTTTDEAEIVAQISAGANFYNYTAHGCNTGFQDPELYGTNPLGKPNDVAAFGNAGEYPLLVGNCCLTGSFTNNSSYASSYGGADYCFGENLLKQADGGAVGYIGASMSTYWDEDLTMGVGSNVESIAQPPLDVSKPGMYDGVMALGYSSQASVKHVGLMAVEQLNTGFTDDYWSAYHLFGDPSVMIYFGIPGTMTASHDGVIAPGATTYTVTTTPYAYVAMGDQNGNLHGAARANSSGVAVVPISTYTVGDTGKLVITAQFKQPYFENVLCTGDTGGDLGLSNTSLNFGYVTVGGNSTMQFTISNAHNSEYLMGDITTITGYSVGEATKNVLTYTVAPNSDKTFDLVFSPSAQTTYSGNIVITSSDTSHPTNNIAVSGTGAYPDISLPAGAGATAAPEGSVTDSFVISNTGTAGLNYSLSNAYVGYQSAGATVHTNDFQAGLVYADTGTQSWATATGGTWNSNSTCAKVSAYTAQQNQTRTGILTSDTFAGTDGLMYLDFDQTATLTNSTIAVKYSINDGSTWSDLYTSSASVTGHQHILIPNYSSSMKIQFNTSLKNVSGSSWSIDNILIREDDVPYTWLTFNSPTTGLVAGSGANTINMTYDAAGLSAGVYESDITVSSDDPDEPSEVVHVAFTVSTGTVPGAPENISVVTATASEVNLGWDAVTGATTYHIYRSTEPYSGFTQIG
ncbi:MAG: C25 family cysteine peptidase, partial [Saccharofermentanales bacterium]